MSSDPATRRLVAIAVLGAGLLGAPVAMAAAAQEPAPATDPATTTAPAPPLVPPAPSTPASPPAPASTPAPSPAPSAPYAAPAAPAPQPAVSAPELAAPTAQHGPAQSKVPFVAPGSGPLDFMRDPLPELKLPEERERTPAAMRQRHNTLGRRSQPAAAGSAEAAAAPGAGEGETLGPATLPAAIPNFFIGRFGIPPFLLSIYQAAGIQYGIRWEVLAAINEIETDYGRNLNVSSAGALGWMQFMPASWRTYGVDANEDGRKDPYNPVDAIFAAARYLRAAGADRDLRAAIFAYNHAGWYVDAVLERARLVAGLPSDLVGSLTGLAQGRSPVAARMRYARRDAGSRPRRGLRIVAQPGAAVVAVQDGEIVRVGRSPRLGRFVMLRDAYGNTYTYAHLARIARSVLAPKERAPAAPPAAASLTAPPVDPVPTEPASAGSNQRAAPTAARSAAPTGRAAPAAGRAVTPTARAAAPAAGAAAKERLFANPARRRSLRSGGRRQILDAAFALPVAASLRSYFAGVVGLERDELELKRLFAGRRVVAGTILGRIGTTAAAPGAPHMLFEIRPPGVDAPRIDPESFLEGWRPLESTAIYRARGPAALAGRSIGQILLMSKDTLARRVLADPAIEIYACGRRDVEAGLVDRRVLATLEFLAASGLRPTVSSLRCGHGFYTRGGNVSQHSSGNGVDIVRINGTPILGNQGAGSLADTTVRRLLTLQGSLAPAQIISLMRYAGIQSTLALADHADHIHVGFRPQAGAGGGREVHALGLRPAQWLRLVDRLGRIDNPVVQPRPPSWRSTRDAVRAAPVSPSLRPPPTARAAPPG